MHAVLFDEDEKWHDLLPLTFTRPVSAIRFGVLTIAEKWRLATGKEPGFLCRSHLLPHFPGGSYADSIYVNGSVCPDTHLLSALSELKRDEAIFTGSTLIACYGDPALAGEKKRIGYTGSLLWVTSITDIFTRNGDALNEDFNNLTRGRTSQKLDRTVTVIGDPSLVFLERGAKAAACILNTTSGPIYIGTDAEIMEGSVIRGPFALGEHSTVKLGAKIYGPTSVGPHCKVGGEINNSVIFGYSNKAHDGFLGNSVLGEWCNLGADTNNSNLKNNYSNVKLFNYRETRAIDTGLQFCGLIMGDHSRCGINTMFNTGTVVGVGANIFGGGFPPTHVPSFSWGGSDGFEPYKPDKLFETAGRVFARRQLTFTDADRELLENVKKISDSLLQEKSSSR